MMEIETNYYVLSYEQFSEYSKVSSELGVSVDYYLDEFTIVEGPDVEFDGEQWVEISD